MKRSTRLWTALAIAMVAGNVFYFVFLIRLESYRVTVGSMEPTLVRRDRAFVLRTKNIARGDLVAYYIPREYSPLVHRAVAMGSDTIEMRDKRVLVNGKELHEPYAKYEEAGGRGFAAHRVPAGHLFVLGDNRDNANDSRYHGDVAMTDVIGRIVFVWSPKNGLHRP